MTRQRFRRGRGCHRTRLAVAWVAACAACGAAAAAGPSRCGFVEGTLVPRVAMGVRTVGGPDIDELEFRGAPDARAAVAEDTRPLFRPLFVVGSATAADKSVWHQLQDGYAAEKPVGWVPARHLHLAAGRYAYTFATRPRDPRADLHDDSRESYERLIAQANGNPDGGGETVVVRERPGAERWQPVRRDDIVPFFELRIPPDRRNREYPDTTPTFRHGIPMENRLVHVGAVCGGPVDVERLRRLGEVVDLKSGIDMLFVADETSSMQPSNKIVAEFIASAGKLAVGRQPPMNIAACFYSDGPPDKRVRLGDFLSVGPTGDTEVRALADDVARRGNAVPDGEYANPPERMLAGLRDALEFMEFRPQATVFVAVVGDTGHEPTDREKPRLIEEVAALVKNRNARVFFMHVGERLRNVGAKTRDKDDDEWTQAWDLFKADCDSVQRAAATLGVPADRVQYKLAKGEGLMTSLEKAHDEVEAEWRKLRGQRLRMESRSPYTEPGPKLLAELQKRGIDRERFEDEHLQYFVPSRGWLFHPTTKDAATARPQLRELFFLAPPERRAVERMFGDIADRLRDRRQIDGDAVVGTFAKDLADAAGAPDLERRVRDAWNALPPDRRSLGVFLEDVLGLRLKAALPFPPAAFTAERPATQQQIDRMLGRIDLLRAAFKKQGDEAFWFEASTLMP